MEASHTIEETNSEDTLPCIPAEIIENQIVPHSAFPWLRVSKKYNKYALKYVVNDPLLREDPALTVSNALSHKNYALLEVLLTDERYNDDRIFENDVCEWDIDRSACMLFLQHFIGRYWIDEILAIAVREDWPEIIEYAFDHEDMATISLDFTDMSEEVFNFVIENHNHPKLKWNNFTIHDDPSYEWSQYCAQLADNEKIPDSTKLKILSLPNIDSHQVLSAFSYYPTLMDALAEDPRVLKYADLQERMWSEIIRALDEDVLYDKIKTILEKRLLDPSVNDNFPLREILNQSNLSNKRKIAQLLLDDDRVILTVEPFEENLIAEALKRSPLDSLEQIKWILSQPKFKREWFEMTVNYLFDQLEDDDRISFFEKRTWFFDPGLVFKDHQLDEYLSEETRAKIPRAVQCLEKLFRQQKAFHKGHLNTGTDSDTSDSDDEPSSPVAKRFLFRKLRQ